MRPQVHAAEKDIYKFLWLDPDKSVYVLQNKLYKKNGKSYFNVSYINGISSAFQSTSGLGGLFGYYFGEEWSVELVFNKYTNNNNSAYETLFTVAKTVPFIRKINHAYGVIVNWSPFYGKINTFNKIFYFDWSFGVGLQRLLAESNAKTVAKSEISDQFEEESFNSLVLKTSFKFHVKSYIHLDVSYCKNMFMGAGPYAENGSRPPDKLRSNTDIIFSLGMSF